MLLSGLGRGGDGRIERVFLFWGSGVNAVFEILMFENTPQIDVLYFTRCSMKILLMEQHLLFDKPVELTTFAARKPQISSSVYSEASKATQYLMPSIPQKLPRLEASVPQDYALRSGLRRLKIYYPSSNLD